VDVYLDDTGWPQFVKTAAFVQARELDIGVPGAQAPVSKPIGDDDMSICEESISFRSNGDGL
jgi:hypothetical protein